MSKARQKGRSPTGEFHLSAMGMTGKLKPKDLQRGHMVGKIRLVNQQDGRYARWHGLSHGLPVGIPRLGVVHAGQGQAAPASFPYMDLVAQFPNAGQGE